MSSDTSDEDKTESASQRRLEQAREEGQIPHSRELATFIGLLAAIGALYGLGGWMFARLLSIMRGGLQLDQRQSVDPKAMGHLLENLGLDALLTLAPFLLVIILSAFVSPFLMGGWVFSVKALKFDFNRLDPVQGITRMFSTHGLAELVKSLLKTALVGGVGAWVLWREREDVFSLMLQPLQRSSGEFAGLVLFSLLLIVMSLLLIALIDVPYQLWEYQRKLRMSKEELRQEMKEQEGDPHNKARIRQAQRAMSRRRMMAQVPTANVVVTNPTHYAVALFYDPDKGGAPVVVAKGADQLAFKIRELAHQHQVPVLEAPPLARALYASCKLDQQIPAALYTVVAEVMAYVYQLNHWIGHGGLPPEAPDRLEVPEGMDPGAPPEDEDVDGPVP
ncbi:flagellar biosynthesis protein FlhB [Zoogloea sp.]|uniref:flagellar biosynthesis protein FlhB n=1 Tax=Zoogloea sp. TaxID=49181 RepID=UPI0035B4A7A2